MSTSVLYHEFGIRGYDYVRTERENGVTTFVISQRRGHLTCPCCGTHKVERRGEVVRRFRVPPVGRRVIQVELAVARVRCFDCDVIRQVHVAFADENRHYSRSFERYVLELLKHMTIKAVAQHLQLGWDVVKEIQKRYLNKHFANPELKKLKKIAIDEICIGKGKFLTLVLDLKTGAVVYVAKGKDSAALEPFWKKLKASRAKIRAAAIDMSNAYTKAVRENLPDAVLVYDHFHIIKLYNEKLTDLRRDLYREAQAGPFRDVLKGIRWLLLKNPENLDPKKREHERLDAALALNKTLFFAYYMKDALRMIWQCDGKRDARKVLDSWIALADVSGIRMLKTFARTLAAHREGILAWYDYRISTGPLEGTNNKIKTMSRQAYGFRDIEYFMLRILAIHNATYALVG
jgi:transposase